MGTWCTEAIKRDRATLRRQEDEIQRNIYYKKKRSYEEECKKEGICPKCRQKIVKTEE